MCWPTNRPFPSDDSVVVLGGLPRQRTDILMDKDAGLSNQLNSFLIYLRMLKVTLRYVLFLFLHCWNANLCGLFVHSFECLLLPSRWKAWMSMLSTFLTSRLIKLRSKDAGPTELMEESTVCLIPWDFSYIFLRAYIDWRLLLAAYMSSPCHIELILSEKEEPVKKEVLIDHLDLGSWFPFSFCI